MQHFVEELGRERRGLGLFFGTLAAAAGVVTAGAAGLMMGAGLVGAAGGGVPGCAWTASEARAKARPPRGGIGGAMGSSNHNNPGF